MRVLTNRGERIDLIAAKPAQAFRGAGAICFAKTKPGQKAGVETDPDVGVRRKIKQLFATRWSLAIPIHNIETFIRSKALHRA